MKEIIRSIAGHKYNKILGSFTLFLLIAFKSYPQQMSTIQGTVRDSLGKTSLALATISVLKKKSKAVLGQTIAKEDGFFRVSNLPVNDSLLLTVRYLEHEVYRQAFFLAKAMVYDIGELLLRAPEKLLDTILIAGRKPPLIIKNDTIEFNAASFKTLPNSVIEELLRKLPGLQIDASGNMTYAGKKISKVLIDGQEFFSDDTRIATRNLPADMVDKIQIMDNKTLEQQASGFRGISNDKALNIKLKKEKKTFASASNGAGLYKRYEAAAMFNHFAGTQKISLITSVNNINKSGFNMNPGADQTIQSVAFSDEKKGIITSKLGGFHFSGEKEKVKYNINYTYNDALIDRSTIKAQKQFISPGSFYFTENNSKDDGKNINHRTFISIECELDSMSTLFINPIFSHGRMTTNNFSNQIMFDENGRMVSSSAVDLSVTGINTNVIANVLWKKRFRKPGAQFSLLFSPYFNNRETVEINRAKILFLRNNGSDSLSQVNQGIHEKSDTWRPNSSIFYTYPLSNTLRLELNEIIQWRYIYTDRKLFNRDSLGNNSEIDTTYSATYSTSTMFSNTTLSLSYTKPKWEISIGANAGYTKINNELRSKDLLINRHELNYAPSVNLAYKIAANKNVSLSFFTNTLQPSLEQLSPIADNTNPLYIKLGNPDLKPVFIANYRANYSSYNSKANITLTGDVDYTSAQNTIVNALSYDGFGRQVSQYVNINGNYTREISLFFTKDWKTDADQKGIGINLSTGQRSIGTFVNGLRTNMKTFNWIPSLSLHYTYKSIADFNVSYALEFYRVSYNPSTLINQKYFRHVLQASLKTTWPKNFSTESNLMYGYHSQLSNGLKKDAILLNVNIMQRIFKNRQGVVKFSVYDLLKQNNNISRTVADNYIEDASMNTLQQFFMLSFLYRLNFKTLKGKK
jgi:hypothetical protein